MAIRRGIQLLYGLTRKAIKDMETRDIEEQLRKLDSVEEDALRYGMSTKSAKEVAATRTALNEELRNKNLITTRDEEYDLLNKELIGDSIWRAVDRVPPQTYGSGGGGVDDAYKGIFTKTTGGDAPTGGVDDAYKGIFTKTRTGTGDEIIPEFSSKNLARIEEMRGIPSGYTLDPRVGYMGPKTGTDVFKYKDITFNQLDQAQQGVYSIAKQSPYAKELLEPGVTADLLDYTRRAGRGRTSNEIIAEYWKTYGSKIRKHLDDINAEMGPDGPAPGTQLDLFD